MHEVRIRRVCGSVVLMEAARASLTDAPTLFGDRDRTYIKLENARERSRTAAIA